MKKIPLTKGKFTIVDDEDYDFLMVRSWCYSGGYAWSQINGRKESMHRFLLNASGKIDVDHININGCDNRRCNIRLATRAQNNYNRHRKNKKNKATSKFKGVHWHKGTSKWHSGIRVDGKRYHLGCFINEIDAAKAYDAAARKHCGEYAKLNFNEFSENTSPYDEIGRRADFKCPCP